jgi:hypothetical protein
MTKSCATCLYWVATEMEAIPANYIQWKDTKAQTEMLRATHALCSWPAATQLGRKAIALGPSWMAQRIRGGDLTSETDGAECPAYEAAE